MFLSGYVKYRTYSKVLIVRNIHSLSQYCEQTEANILYCTESANGQKRNGKATNLL